MPDAWRVYGRDCDAGAQSIVDRFIQVRVLQISSSVVAINSVCGHDDCPPRRGCGPALHQISERKIWAAINASQSHRKAQRFCRQRMIASQILDDLSNAVAHISDTNHRGVGL